MANRFFSPDEQFADSTGKPYAGGTLSFFASGTSTPLATYSNQALTIANTNPIVLDSAGRAGAIFLQNLAYKVALADVLGNPIWTQDPVYSSDFSTAAAFLVSPGNPNGNVAGNQGSGAVPASVVWDSVDNLLYVCTSSGTSTTAVWTAISSSASGSTPSGMLAPYAGTVAPSGWLLAAGQNVSRTTFSTLFGVIGTVYGAGDGSTTFGLPDLRGRAAFGVDNMGGSAANRITNAGGTFDGTVLGGAGGNQNQTLTQAQLPAISPGITITDPGHSHNFPANEHTVVAVTGLGFTTNNPGGPQVSGNSTASATTGITAAFSANLGSGNSHPILSPAFILNYIIKT